METSLRIATPWEGAPVYLKERTHSTMDDALALARAGSPAGTTVVAGYQERGRGRAPGRVWLSGAWESLLATVVLRRADSPPPSQLPLRAGLAASLAVEEAAGITVAIKRPNDILWEGRKLAGILCESRGDILLVGIGVNCLQLSFPPEIAQSACSLRQACGRDISPLELLPLVLARLKASLEDALWREKVSERLLRRDR
jgi:BirA family biotin operon repressor/biotin-[acetyl-CoA-carboxylase] ligase